MASATPFGVSCIDDPSACTGSIIQRYRDQRRLAVLHYGFEIGRNIVLGLEVVRCVVAAEFHINSAAQSML